MDIGRLLFSADGRIGQKEFWTGFLILFIGGILIHVVPLAGTLIWALSTYCWICLYSKRLHDFGKSGWHQLWVFVLGYLCVAIGVVVAGGGAIAALATGHWNWPMFAGAAAILVGLFALSALAHFLFLLYVGLSPTQRAANKYGPPTDPTAPI